MRIGILETGPVNAALRERFGGYPGMFERMLDGRGFSFRTWTVHEGEMPEGPHDADGWVVTGSKYGVYEDHAFIGPLEAFIRACREAGVPMAGICFGHQIMAQALGGRVEKAAVGWGVGRQEYVSADGAAVSALAFHQDQVLDPPAGAETLAGSGFCPHAALRYGDWGLSWQPHPEFSVDFVAALIEARTGAAFDEAFAAERAASLAAPTDGGAIAASIGDFLQNAMAKATAAG